MKKLWNTIKALAPHVSIICTGMILTFLVIEWINPYAGFINHRYTKIVLTVWVVSALLSAILLIAAQRREFRRRERRRRAEQARQRETGDEG